MTNKSLIAIVLLCFSLNLYSMDIKRKGLILGFNGGVSIPAGDFGKNFSGGMGLALTGKYSFGSRYLFIESDFIWSSYNFTENTISSLNSYYLGVGPVLYNYFHPYFQPFLGLSFGIDFYKLSLETLGESSLAIKPAAFFKTGILMSPTKNFGIQLSYNLGLSSISNTLFKNNYISLAGNIRTDFFTKRSSLGRKESLVQIQDVKLNPIFGAKYGVYKDKNIGSVIIENVGRNPLYKVYVKTGIEEITDKPTSSKKINVINPGQKLEVEIPVAINKKILDIVEDRDLPIRFQVIYQTKRGQFSYVEDETILVHPKNAISWNNTINIGSFITPKEDTISNFSRNTVSSISSERVIGIPTKMIHAISLFAAIGAHGVTYVTDPNEGFTKGQKDRNNIDYVMYARETLKKKAGDCDDLTALYASALESIGIKTAVVTGPGHILLMFDTEIPASRYKSVSSKKDLVYVRNGTVWVPVETTMVGKNFIAAWKNAAATINQYQNDKGNIEILDTSSAWEKYQPTDLGTGYELKYPDANKIKTLYTADISVLKKLNYDDERDRLLAQISQKGKDHVLLNKLGILYGRFGHLKESQKVLLEALTENPDYAPVYCNLGNIHLLKKEHEKALEYFNKAINYNPGSHLIRINLARLHFELGNKDKAKALYELAVQDNDGYKKKYSYLSGENGKRAFEINNSSENFLWDDTSLDE